MCIPIEYLDNIWADKNNIWAEKQVHEEEWHDSREIRCVVHTPMIGTT